MRSSIIPSPTTTNGGRSTTRTERRAALGITDIAVLRDADDPNSVWIVGEADSDNVEALLSDPDLAKVMQEAGVTGPPKFWVA